MSQINLAVQQPEDQPNRSRQGQIKIQDSNKSTSGLTPLSNQSATQAHGRSEIEQTPSNASNAAHQQAEQFSNQIAKNQAEIERIRAIDIYVGMQRDVNLRNKLNDWRDLLICGRIKTIDCSGLSKALDWYSKDYVKRRGGLLQLPVLVMNVEAEQNGGIKELFRIILNFLGSPYDFQRGVQALRLQTWGTLKSARVKLLIINNASFLTLPGLWELVRIFEKLKISIVLAGFSDMEDTLTPQSWHKHKAKRTAIHNTFLEYHQFNSLSPGEVGTFVKEWEEQGLRWSTPLNLYTDQQIILTLHSYSQGQVELLHQGLRKIANWKLKNPKAQINFKNVDSALKQERTDMKT